MEFAVGSNTPHVRHGHLPTFCRQFPVLEKKNADLKSFLQRGMEVGMEGAGGFRFNFSIDEVLAVKCGPRLH